MGLGLGLGLVAPPSVLGAAATVTHGLALLRLSCRARLSQRRAGGSGSRAALLGRSRGPWHSWAAVRVGASSHAAARAPACQ